MQIINRIQKNLETNNVDSALESISRFDIQKLSEIEFKEYEKEVKNCFQKFGYKIDIEWDMRRKKYNYISNFVLNHFDGEERFDLLCRIKNWEAYKIIEGGDINDIKVLIEYLKGENEYTIDDVKKDVFMSKRRTGFNFDTLTKQTLIYLSFFYSDLTEKLIKYSTLEEAEISLKELSHLVSRITYLNEYPFRTGGGEEYFRSCILENNEYGIFSHYIRYSEVTSDDNFHTIYPELVDRVITTCKDKQELVNKIMGINPTSLKSMGQTNLIAAEIANELRIKTQLGYHFWTHFIDLHEGNNIEIIKNIEKHQINVNFEKKSKFIDKYVVSNFMLDVYKSLGGLDEVPINYPITTFDIYSTNEDSLSHRTSNIKNVLQMNINELKGGKIFFELANEHKSHDIKFTGVYTEKTNDIDFAKTIEDAKRSKFDNIEILNFTNKDELLQKADLILVPSLVDETFSRIAFEAMIRNKIIITSRSGNLEYLNDGGFFFEEINDFKKMFNFLESKAKESEYISKQKIKVDKIKESVVENFIKSIGETSKFTKLNIGIVSQIGPSGLGQLTQHLFGVFQDLGFSTYVLAALPYEFEGSTEYFDIQENYDPVYKNRIHKSLNYRELVTDFEINNFIETFSINTLIIPEIVNMENWERIFRLNWNNLAIISIPMLEIVNLNEIVYYSYLTQNLHVTKISFDSFNKYQIGDNQFIGHAMKPNKISFSEKRSDTIKLLFVGGRNAFRRKNLEKFLEAYLQATRRRSDLHLTVSLSTSEFFKVDKKYKVLDDSQINFKVGNFTNEEIEKLIIESDLGVLLSKSEGLGFGFWDFNCRGIPVLTHKGYPHLENSNIAGNHNYEIAATPIPLSDTTTGIFMEFDFDKKELIEFLKNVTKDELIKSKKEIGLINFNKQFYDYQIRILKALDLRYTTIKSKTKIQRLNSVFRISRLLIKGNIVKQFISLMASKKFPYDPKHIDTFQTYFTYRSFIKLLIGRNELLQRNQKIIKIWIQRHVKYSSKY